MDQFPVKARSGWIEVITGSMFSGKSEELIRRLRRAQIARQQVQIFKPAVDNRYSDGRDRLAQRDEDPVDERGDGARALRARASGHRSVGIDEGQFFDAELPGRAASGSPTTASASSSPDSIRTIWASRSSRCRNCWPPRSTSPRRWRSAWSAAARPTTRSGWWRRRSACWSAPQAPTRPAAGIASIRRSGRNRIVRRMRHWARGTMVEPIGGT